MNSANARNTSPTRVTIKAFIAAVTGVGFFIHMFASWYMRGEEGYSRFFAYTNLFIASMVVLVLAQLCRFTDRTT